MYIMALVIGCGFAAGLIYYKRNSIVRAKKNIYDHYDLGNSFFKLFLDKNWVYSSAVFESPDQPLEDAQLNKINQVLDLADIQPNHKILEIGSGWGALAIHAATTIGCHVTTVTISEEQYNFVKKKINIDGAIIRFLTVKYKKLDLENEFFKKDKLTNEKKK